MDASLSNEHLARVEAHAHLSAVDLADVRDALVAHVARASSLHVTEPERHLLRITDKDARNPAYLAKRVPKEVVIEARSRRPMQNAERGIADLHGKMDDLIDRLTAPQIPGGLNRDQVAALLRAFSEVDVDVAGAMDLLLSKAQELRALQHKVARRASTDAGSDTVFKKVLEFFTVGDFDKADDTLKEITTSEASARDAVLSDTARIYTLRGDLALARLRYDDAADHYGTAAAIAGVSNKTRAFGLLGEQAQVYMDKALILGDRMGLQQAFAISARRIELAPARTEQRLVATGQFISYLGIAAERASAPEAKQLTAKGA